MLEILQYSFFQNALIWWILISIMSSILWVFVVMRKEANVTHSISNFLFLWIAISFLFSWNYYFFAFLFWIIASLILFFIERTNFVTKESSKEIISQLWIAWAIFTISLLNNLTLDINSLLFWSILFINKNDLIILFFLTIIIIFLFKIFHKNFLRIILAEDIARSLWLKVSLYNFVFLLILSFFIAISLKIFWILLIWAFLVIPANISKIVSNNLKNVFIFSFLISIFATVFWIIGSYFLNTWTWATIVLILIMIFLFSIIYKKTLKN